MNFLSRFAVITPAILLAGQVQAQIHLVSDEVRRAALASEANIERMVMVPMRDGVRLATRVYLPRDGEGPFPAILWRSPYNFSEKMVPDPDYSDANLKFALDAVRHGYAFVMQNERGKFFSDGDWEILGRPRTDGHDSLTWIAEQPWSDGKVGTIGCSSTAESILGLASLGHPAHVAAVPMAAGAGIGRMGPHYEQGNYYKGGAIQLPMLAWLYGEQNLERPTFPADMPRDELIRVSKYYDLAPDMPEVDWPEAFRRLPLSEAIVAAGGPRGIFDEMVDRGPDGRGVVPGRPLSRPRGFPCTGVVGEFLVRPLGRTEHRPVQSRSHQGERSMDPGKSIHDRRSDGTLPHVPLARPARHRRARHGTCPFRTRRDRVRVLRLLHEGRTEWLCRRATGCSLLHDGRE